MDKDKAIIR